MEIQQRIGAAHGAADDEHVAGQNADVGPEGREQVHHLPVVFLPVLCKGAEPGAAEHRGGKANQGQPVLAHLGKKPVGAVGLSGGAVAENELNAGVELAGEDAVLDEAQQARGSFPPASGQPADVEHC